MCIRDRPYGRFKGLAMVAVAIVAASACSSATSTPTASTAAAGSANPSSSASTVSHKPVTISVGVLRPGATQEATDALNLQISEFEAKYPWVTVEPQEYNWTAPTFTAALAAGTLPDVFTIPFTDGKGLIQQHQIVNIDSRVRALPYIDKFNKSILANGQDDKGAIWAVPYQAYGMSLTYNRTLFKQAGLDPDKAPTTWDEVKADAKALKANNQAVGVPTLPLFDKATYDQVQVWIKDYVNVPTSQMTPFTSKIFDEPLVTEPTKNTQDLYAALDPVLQAVLTDKNANIDTLLSAANKQVQTILDKG